MIRGETQSGLPGSPLFPKEHVRNQIEFRDERS
jgi:hypothetical protein